MDYELTDEQKTLQEEWNGFYREMMRDAPKNLWGASLALADAYYGEGFEKATDAWVKKLYGAENERGYLNQHWPKEYGGKEMGPVEQCLLSEIKSYYRFPEGNSAGLRLLAPSIMQYGSDEQKKEFLPKILSGETWFCQAWSEPNAGSDLASLTTRAVRDGDRYVINGQKTWVSQGERSNWGHSPFRTDPDSSKRHRGLSYFMYPLDLPGITVRSLYCSGQRTLWSEIFFEDVSMPVEYMVGEENRGWYVTMATANSERSGARHGGLMRDLEDITAYCMETNRNGQLLIEDPFIQEGLADLSVEMEKLRVMSFRSAWEQSKGENVTKYASAAKIMQTELIHKMSTFVNHRIGGLYGPMRVGSDWALFDGVYESLWEIDLGRAINQGTNEVQHNVMASRFGLNLPSE